MATVFTITRGLPEPLAFGALEMLTFQAGGGQFGMANDADYNLMIVLEDNGVITNFRSHLWQLGTVEFTESNDVPPIMFLIHYIALPEDM